VDESVDHGRGYDVVAEYFALANGLLEVTISEALSLRQESSWKNKLAASGSKGM
jgi:hypothetical protein